MKPLVDLMKEIKENTLPHYNVWMGEEIAVLNIYQGKLKELGYKVIPTDTVTDAITLVNKKGFDNSIKCFVVTDDTDYVKQEKQWEKVQEKFNKSKHTLLLKYTNIDKRSKFLKQNNEIVNFEKLSTEVLEKYIKKDLPKFNDRNIEKLIEYCDSSYNLILLEMDKIRAYSDYKQYNYNASFDELLAQGVVYKPVGDIIFQFIDAVSYGDVAGTKVLLEKIKLKKENELAILSLLYTSFKNMLMVNALGKDKSNATERTGLTAWQVRKAKENLGAYSTKELVRAVEVLRKIEKGIKTGEVPTSISLDYVTLEIMR